MSNSVTQLLIDNLKARDASASKKTRPQFLDFEPEIESRPRLCILKGVIQFQAQNPKIVAVSFLSDPGVPGVRSMGPNLC